MTPEDLEGRLAWLSLQGTLKIIKEDYPWSRKAPWSITVEIGAMKESWIEAVADDLFVAAGDAICAVRHYWWVRGQGESKTYSVGGVVLNDK
jgi:hypothetical protein